MRRTKVVIDVSSIGSFFGKGKKILEGGAEMDGKEGIGRSKVMLEIDLGGREDTNIKV